MKMYFHDEMIQLGTTCGDSHIKLASYGTQVTKTTDESLDLTAVLGAFERQSDAVFISFFLRVGT